MLFWIPPLSWRFIVSFSTSSTKTCQESAFVPFVHQDHSRILLFLTKKFFQTIFQWWLWDVYSRDNSGEYIKSLCWIRKNKGLALVFWRFNQAESRVCYSRPVCRATVGTHRIFKREVIIAWKIASLLINKWSCIICSIQINGKHNTYGMYYVIHQVLHKIKFWCYRDSNSVGWKRLPGCLASAYNRCRFKLLPRWIKYICIQQHGERIKSVKFTWNP